MNDFSELTGRSYKLFEYHGHPQAERVIIIMGSGSGAVEETVEYMNKMGEKVGYLQVHLYRPFSVKHFINVLPTTVQQIAVMDRCKETGAIGEPLFMDIVNAMYAAWTGEMPLIIGGRYGLASKEFNPAMVLAIFKELKSWEPKKQFTV